MIQAISLLFGGEGEEREEHVEGGEGEERGERGERGECGECGECEDEGHHRSDHHRCCSNLHFYHQRLFAREQAHWS